ncbi:hypothetical protein [Halobacillus sp. B23F22_1]|uniref:hypothetical protein n=1 Tax=Halobacillus sp. B23F22_1 TaxID=3459514 RepID=UPI00373DF5BF
MLEATIKYAAIDKLCNGRTLEEKLEYLYKHIPRSSIDPIDDIGLPKVVVTDIKELYSLLCQFVHPSKKQISEYKLQFEKANLGFETHKELNSFNQVLLRTFDVILYIVLYTRGYYVMKDVFNVLSDEPNWKFHKGKHIKTLPNKHKPS